MDRKLKIPPIRKSALSPPETLAKRLQSLIGQQFSLTGKSRTDGSNIRKLVARTLLQHILPDVAPEGTYEIVPPRNKGVPKILREFIDTYIITTGTTYNLQVWNRNPASDSVQVLYADGNRLSAKDVRFVFVQVDPLAEQISSIVILTPEYIEKTFGVFGKPTIKHQLIIPGQARSKILAQAHPVFMGEDTAKIKQIAGTRYQKPDKAIHNIPEVGEIFSLALLHTLLSPVLLDSFIAPDATKNRGQTLELIVANTLVYSISADDVLAGGYPDIKNQLLEIKIQDSPTVDLGLYSPQFEEELPDIPEATTRDIRYLIALMNPKTSLVEGLILCSGADLGENFTYVADKSFKSQRSIPMSFFNRFNGQSVFNPQEYLSR